MTNVTAVQPQVIQLHPIASSAAFDVRLSADGSLLLYREDTNACIVDIKLTPEQIAQIQQAGK